MTGKIITLFIISLAITLAICGFMRIAGAENIPGSTVLAILALIFAASVITDPKI